MELIDREALKEAIHSSSLSLNREWLLMDLDEIIDNAPTVEYPFYAEAYQTGYEEGKNERPQGEWKQISPAKIYECNLCHKTVMTSDIEEYHFCHGCGADMRKGGAE